MLGRRRRATSWNGGWSSDVCASDLNGTPYGSFTFRVQDDGGTANGGVDTATAANTFTFNVTSVNDAPQGTDNSKTIAEDASYTFATADFRSEERRVGKASRLGAGTSTAKETKRMLKV